MTKNEQALAKTNGEDEGAIGLVKEGLEIKNKDGVGTPTKVDMEVESFYII